MVLKKNDGSVANKLKGDPGQGEMQVKVRPVISSKASRFGPNLINKSRIVQLLSRKKEKAIRIGGETLGGGRVPGVFCLFQ
ncbi:MAG: hypothetical protein ABIF77_09465 [bacterium]